MEPVNSAISLKVAKARSIKMCRASLKNFAETNISKVSKEKITENFKLSNLKFYKPLQTFVNRAVDVFVAESLAGRTKQYSDFSRTSFESRF